MIMYKLFTGKKNPSANRGMKKRQKEEGEAEEPEKVKKGKKEVDGEPDQRTKDNELMNEEARMEKREKTEKTDSG